MKIKRKALSVLSCLALIASSLPSTAVFVSADESTLTTKGNPQYVTIEGSDKTIHALFANGTDITVTYNEKNQSNTVTYTKVKEDGSTVEVEIEGVATDANVFAGCHGDKTEVGTDEDPVEITIDGAHLNTVYGGGLHESTVNNVKITVKGDSKLNWVCGGGANCLVHCKQEVCNDKGWKNDAANSATLVKKAEVTIENGTVANDVYGGGEGYSKTESTTVNIKGGTINSVCAGGSNGATGDSQVNIESGTIKWVYSVNRGTMDRSAVTVTGGEIENLYVGSAGSDYPSINGTVNEASVNVGPKATVTNFKPGQSNGQELKQDSFTGEDSKFSFTVDPEAKVTTYAGDLNTIKDTENDYYYFTPHESDGTAGDVQGAAKDLKCFPQVVTGSGSSNTGVTYQYATVMANGETVIATDADVDGKEKGEEGYKGYAQTKITCGDGSYVLTNYDAIALFGGKHNDETPTSTSVTLKGTTHVKYVYGGGLHKSNTTTANVVIEEGTEVYRVQGGAANFFKYDNAACGDSTCQGYNQDTKKNKECWKPVGDNWDEAVAKVENSTVTINGCVGTYKDPANPDEALKTVVFGGGESYAYTSGTSTVTVNNGTIDTLYAAGSNGNTASAVLNIEGGTINKAASAKSGKVGNVEVTVSGESTTVTELVVGARANEHGMATVDSAKVTVSGGTVTTVIDGDVDNAGQTQNTETNKEKYGIVADGGKIGEITGSSDSSADEYGESGNIDCNHDRYEKAAEVAEDPATCGEDGTYAYWQCGNCKRYFAENTDAKKGELQDVTKENEDGSLTVDPEKIKMVAGSEHHVFETVEPKVNITCKDQDKKGMEAHATCTVCGKLCKATLKDGKEDETSRNPEDYDFVEVDSNEDLYIDAPKHTPKTIDALEATCTKEGHSEYSVCEDCGAILTVMTITPMKAHTQGEVVKGTPASCTKTGLTDGYQCTVCKQTYGQTEIPVDNTKHTFTDYKYNNDATCEADGTETAVCDECKVAKDTRTKAETALGHEYVAVEAKAATCTEDGIKEGYYQCSNEGCGKYFKAETTGEEAQTVYTEVSAEEIIEPAKGHTSKTVEAVAATCTKTGLTEGEVCEVCGTVLKAQEEIPMIDHTVEKLSEVKATCEIWGLTEGTKCSVCGKILVAQTLVPPLGHDYDKNGVCTRDGAKDPNYVANSSVDNGNSKPSNSSNNNNINNNNNNNNSNITTAPANKIPASALKVKQAKVKNLKAKSKAKKTIKVNWKKVSGAKGYKIEVSKNSKFKKKAIVIKKTTKKLKLKIKNKKLKSKKTYYVRVRAYTTYKANGATKKVYSSLKAIKKVKVK